VLEPVLTDLDLPAGSRLLLFVNGMGGTPLSELYIAYRRAAEVLSDRGHEVARSLVGNYVTSLEMQGFSITVTVLDDDLLTLWDAPVETPALRWGR
jgi:dihydroxyacetone kinase-like protein